MDKYEFVFEGEALYVYIPVYNLSNVAKKQLVMTREMFVKCWELWIAPKKEAAK